MTTYRHAMDMKVDYATIGKRVRERRNYMGYSQEQLAFECGYSVPYISQIENGHKSVSLNALLDIADAIDCTLDWLVFGNNELYIPTSGPDFNCLTENCTPEEKRYLYNLLSMNVQMLKSRN